MALAANALGRAEGPMIEFEAALAATFAPFSLLMLAARPWQGPGPALEIDWPWIPTLGVRLHLTVDGISWPLIVLTAALGLAVTVHATLQSPVATADAVASGESAPTGSMRSLVVALLAVEGGALATFTALKISGIAGIETRTGCLSSNLACLWSKGNSVLGESMTSSAGTP